MQVFYIGVRDWRRYTRPLTRAKDLTGGVQASSTHCSPAGSFLVLCAIVSRLRMPNPLVAVPYIRQWNTILLGIGLFLFRFCLVRPSS